jgi:hypothetical protein
VVSAVLAINILSTLIFKSRESLPSRYFILNVTKYRPKSTFITVRPNMYVSQHEWLPQWHSPHMIWIS